MSRGGYRSPLIENPNVWLGDEKRGLWEYGSYRYCYLTIRHLDNGKYQPAVGAFTDIPYPGYDLPASKKFEYNTLDQAKKHLFEYVDYIRDVCDKQAKLDLQKRLDILNPKIE